MACYLGLTNSKVISSGYDLLKPFFFASDPMCLRIYVVFRLMSEVCKLLGITIHECSGCLIINI